MEPRTYEITFTGQASPVLRAALGDCQLTPGPRTTTARATLPDEAALSGLIERIISLRREVVHVLRVPPATTP